MFNEIKLNEESSSLIKNGVDKLANAVKITLGPRGKNVIIANPYGYPHVTKDGATVAASVTLENQTENIGAMMLRDAAIRTAKDAGDGTTTSTIYAQELYHYFYNSKEPISIVKEKLNQYNELINEKTKQLANKCTKEDLVKIASLSANNDTKLGEFLYDVYSSIGSNGSITTQTSNTLDTYVKYVRGIKLNSGYMSSKFINVKEKGTFEGENVKVFVINNKIEKLEDIHPYTNKINKEEKALFVVKGIDEYVLNTLIYNVVKNKLNLAIIQMPGFGIAKDLYFEAINDTLGEFVVANKVVVSLSETVIEFGINHNQEKIDKLNYEIDNYDPNSEIRTYDIETLKEILAIYTANSAVINVGGFTEGEVREKMDRIEDALMAMKSADELGWIYGSSLTSYKVLHEVMEENGFYNCNVYDSILQAVGKPLQIMCEQSGLNYDEITSEMVDSEYNKLINIRSLKYEYCHETNIIEPAKVFIKALTNAINIAMTLLSTGCTIEYNEKG